MSGSGRITDHPIKLSVTISEKKDGGGWNVTPSLTAFPKPQNPFPPQDIIFVLDRSGSMAGHRWKKVQDDMVIYLNKLTEKDRFAIIAFDDKAEILVPQQTATKENIVNAQISITHMQTQAGGTNFKSAFETAKTLDVTKESSLLFLTDGENESKDCNADTLLNLFPEVPRIIPIGVCLAPGGDARLLLNRLFQKSCKKRDEAIFIETNDDPEAAFSKAFNRAYALTAGQSSTPARLEMIMEAESKQKDEKEEMSEEISIKTLQKEKINDIVFNGKVPASATFTFPSMQPTKMIMRFYCGDTLVAAEHKLTPKEQEELKHGSVTINIPAFKWKDYSTFSWFLAIGSATLGALILAAVAMSVVTTPVLMLWAWKSLIEAALVSLVGLSLFLKGLVAIARKTIFLPTQLTANEIKEEEKPPLEEKTSALQNFTTKMESLLYDLLEYLDYLFPPSLRKKMLAGSTLATVGGVAGYFSSKIAAVSALIPAGVSSSLFAACCSVTGAVMLPLLAYGCWRLYSFANSDLRRPSRKTIAAGTIFAAGGATAGYLGSSTSAATALIPAGISASTFVMACTIGSAIALPLLAYGCWKLYSLAKKHPNKLPSKKSVASCTLFVASSATAGYLVSSTSAATALIPTGISASTFIMACTLGSAVALPLLAYSCWKLYSLAKKHQDKLPSKTSVAACTFFAAGGAAAGHAISSTSAVSALIPIGVSASTFITACTIASAFALPLLLYGCLQLHNTYQARGRVPTRFI